MALLHGDYPKGGCVMHVKAIKAATSAMTVKRTELISFLTEINTYLETFLPALHKECCFRTITNVLKKNLGKPIMDFYKYTIFVNKFSTRVRNCARKRSIRVGNPIVELSRITVDTWPTRKARLSATTTQKELFSVANQLIDTAVYHLGEVLLDITYTNIQHAAEKGSSKK